MTLSLGVILEEPQMKPDSSIGVDLNHGFYDRRHR